MLPLEDRGGIRSRVDPQFLHGSAKMRELVFRDRRTYPRIRLEDEADLHQPSFCGEDGKSLLNVEHEILYLFLPIAPAELMTLLIYKLNMHWFRASSISTASFLVFLMAACHCASLPRPSNPRESSIQRSNKYLLSSAHTAYSVHYLKPRILDLTLIHFDHTHFISPINTAAQVLSHFYAQIYLGAGGTWASNKQRIWIKVTLGSFQLLVSATKGHTVPWSFVKWWAVEMLQLIDKGYVATYDAYFVSPDGNEAVIISLTCRAIGAMNSAAAVAISAVEDVNGNGRQSLNLNARPFNPP